MASPGRQEKVIDEVRFGQQQSIRRCCRVLGMRRSTYHSRKAGHRPDQVDQAGKPSQNGLIERLNKTLRRECLNLTCFQSMEQLNEEIQAWSHIYNELRPHKNIGRIPPAQHEIDHQNFYYKPVAA